MQRRAHRVPLTILVIVVALAAIVLTSRDGGNPISGAAPLPTACENFARASDLFAHGGSAHALEMTGDQVFTRDASADSRQIMMDLMESCDAERSAH